MKQKVPDTIRAKLVKAGKARAKQITHDERVEFGKRAWETRIAKENGK